MSKIHVKWHHTGRGTQNHSGNFRNYGRKVNVNEQIKNDIQKILENMIHSKDKQIEEPWNIYETITLKN